MQGILPLPLGRVSTSPTVASNPNEWVGSDRPWSDIRDVSEFQRQGKSIAYTP